MKRYFFMAGLHHSVVAGMHYLVLAGLTRHPLLTIGRYLAAYRTERYKSAILLLFITCLLTACDQPLTSSIPSAPVNLELRLSFEDSDLVPALAAKSITQKRRQVDLLGFGGVLVVSRGYNPGGALELFAYDLACPYEVDRNVRVVPDEAGKARCPKCGSVYVTMWGMGVPETSSASKYPLRSYVVRAMGGNVFLVLN